MVHTLSGWVDVDRPSLGSLASAERIDYLEKRVNLVVIKPLERILNNEVLNWRNSSAVLVFGVSLCCAIEATGKFVTGGTGGNGVRFDAFLNAYMNPDYRSKSIGPDTYGNLLWTHFRNGLAHGFVVCHGGFDGNKKEPYFREETITGTRCLKVNPFHFFDDYCEGFAKYLSDLRSGPPTNTLFTNFNSVFERVFVEGH